MAIKVKHEGNVTSRIYASAAGGKGKRQAEDAKVLASMQRGGMGGGGGTGGGARAGGSAPTLSAPTSHAQLGSTGSLISPRNTFKQQKELQKQQDDAILARQKDEQEWKSGENQKELAWKTKENQKEIDARAEQGRLTREARQKELEDERVWKEQHTSWEEQGYDAEQRMNLRELHRKRNSIAEDPKLRDNQTERDAALKDIDDQIARIKPINPPKSNQDAFNDSIVTDATTGIRYRKDVRGNWIPMETTQPKPMSPQEIYKSAYRDENGTLWIGDNKGGIVPLQNTTPSEAKPDLQRAKYITSRVAELMDETNGSNQKIIENGGKLPTREEAEQIAMREYDSYTGAGATPTPAATPKKDGAQSSSTKPLPVDEEKKKTKWGSFAR